MIRYLKAFIQMWLPRAMNIWSAVARVLMECLDVSYSNEFVECCISHGRQSYLFHLRQEEILNENILDAIFSLQKTEQYMWCLALVNRGYTRNLCVAPWGKYKYFIESLLMCVGFCSKKF